MAAISSAGEVDGLIWGRVSNDRAAAGSSRGLHDRRPVLSARRVLGREQAYRRLSREVRAVSGQMISKLQVGGRAMP